MADTEIGLRAKLVAEASTKRRPPLASLQDVDTAGLADGDTLVWDASAGK